MVLSLIIIMPVAAYAENVFYVHPADEVITGGVNFTVGVRLNATDDVYAAQAVLDFDPTVLVANAVSEGNFLNYDGASTSYPKGVSIDNANGRVYFANTRLNPAVNGVSGDRELFSVYFSPLGIWGKTYMNLSGLKLSDPDGSYLFYSTRKGTRTLTPVYGDVNGDCIVDIFDLARVGIAYGTYYGNPYWNPSADVNKDGEIDILDLGTVGLHYWEECCTTNSPPEMDAGGPYVINEGEPLELDASESADPDEGCGDSIEKYVWDLDGDGDYEHNASGSKEMLLWPDVESYVCGGTCSANFPYTLWVKGWDTKGSAGTSMAYLFILSNCSPSTEICDGLDNDCDGQTDEDFPTLGDVCSVGIGACQSNGHIVCTTDGSGVECDAVAGTPQTETCNGLDDDCDGAVDDNLTPPPCELQTGVCYGSTKTCAGVSGWSACGPSDYGADYEQTETRCDGLDNDCDGQTDEDCGNQSVICIVDADHDGFGTMTGATVVAPDGSCDAEDGESTTSNDCNDADAAINPGAAEVCGDAVDNDCDGQIDEEDGLGCFVFYPDADNDGYGAFYNSKCLCSPTGIYSATTPGDCNDENADINPGAQESCNGIDDDCDAEIDEEGAMGCTTYYYDGDSDGYGLFGNSKCLCSPTGIYRATTAGDCNDADANISPGADEVCNAIDDDCNGVVDDGISGASDGGTNDACSQSSYFGVIHENDAEVSWSDKLYPSGDKDFFRFYANEDTGFTLISETFTVRIRLIPPQGAYCSDFDLYLYDDSCNLLASSKLSGCSEETITFSWDGDGFTDDSRYFRVGVEGYSGAFSCSPYSLYIDMYEE
ncbi:MAG: hypothetical protein J7K54_03395 [Candidatus Aenigmarchaeota archaeon]|nr:hypothetical protein [Candidatus Aenigmarchaeota archaeon]